MITVTFETEKQFYSGFSISGHADGFGGNDEYDLICAAVSAISLTTAEGLKDVLRIPGTYDSASGFMQVALSSENEKSQLLMETFHHGLTSIREAYPGHLEIKEIKG